MADDNVAPRKDSPNSSFFELSPIVDLTSSGSSQTTISPMTINEEEVPLTLMEHMLGTGSTQTLVNNEAGQLRFGSVSPPLYQQHADIAPSITPSHQLHQASDPVAPGVTTEPPSHTNDTFVPNQITTSTLPPVSQAHQVTTGVTDMRVIDANNLKKLKILAREYNEYPILDRIENTDEIDEYLSECSDLSIETVSFLRLVLQDGIYASLGGEDPQKKKLKFQRPIEIQMLKDCISQEPKVKVDWNRIVKILRSNSWVDCKEAGLKILEESQDIYQPPEHLILAVGEGGSIVVDENDMPTHEQLKTIITEYNKLPVPDRVRETDIIDRELADEAGVSLGIAQLCRLTLQLGIYESLKVSDNSKRKADFDRQIEKDMLRKCATQEKRGFEDFHRMAKILRIKDWLAAKEGLKKLREEDVATAAVAVTEMEGGS